MKGFKNILFLCFLAHLCFGQYTISGTVLGEDGKALIGANILVKETTIGTVTDLDGTFSLKFESDRKESIIVVSFTGLESQEIPISQFDQTNTTVALIPVDPLNCPISIGPLPTNQKNHYISFGPLYDQINNFKGAHIQQSAHWYRLGVSLISDIQLGIGNQERLAITTSNEITNLIHVDNATYFNLLIDYDYIKTEFLTDDIIDGIDLKRFVVMPRFMGRGFKFGLGYLNQKELNSFSNPDVGFTADLEFSRIKSFDINLYGRVEFIETGTQYILSAQKTFPKLRTTLSVQYRDLHRYNSLSLSVLYNIWH